MRELVLPMEMNAANQEELFEKTENTLLYEQAKVLSDIDRARIVGFLNYLCAASMTHLQKG